MKILANSSLCCKYIDDILKLAVNNYFNAIEWDLNFIPPTLSKNRINSILKCIERDNIKIRFHLPYAFIEVAHQDKEIRNFSILTIQHYIDFIARLNGNCSIIHVGYNDGSKLNIALDSIYQLAQYASNKGIVLCIENLIYGLSTNPQFINDVLTIGNTALCLDIGHADVVMKKTPEFFDLLKDNIKNIYHAHCYKTEDNYFNHIAFTCKTEVENSCLFSLLRSSNCLWYTMELDSENDQRTQIELLQNF